MKKLRSEYWDIFMVEIKTENGKTIQKGNGEEFECLVDQLLTFLYGRKWTHTQKSHDHNRDFCITLEDQNIWAECKNYQAPIAMDVLAPTLVMAQIYEVNEILFFSRSEINTYAKTKIMSFGEKVGKTIVFHDGKNLEALIWNYRYELSDKHSPLNYYDEEYIDPANNRYVNIYFFKSAISYVQSAPENFIDYEHASEIYYNETFALTFCLENPFREENVQAIIEFADDGNERFSFQYFRDSVTEESRRWYSETLKQGEGRAISLNMRRVRYKSEIFLPKFRVSFLCTESDKKQDWISKEVPLKCRWVGATRLIGSNYLKILCKAKQQLVDNPYFSGMVITGSSGTGKTRILSECQNVFLKKGYHIIHFSGQKDFDSRHFLKELTGFLYEIPGEEIVNLLEERLFTDTIDDDGNHITKNSEAKKAIALLKKVIRCESEKDLHDTLDQYGDILYEKLSKDRNVLIIDNVQYLKSAFLYFLEQYIYFSVNQQTSNRSVVVLAFNRDYMTAAGSELLYNIGHANIKHYLPFEVNGFIEEGQGVQFLQELTRTRKDENTDYFSKIIKKVSLTPYNLFQTVKYLEEADIIRITPEKTGYIVPGTKKYDILSHLSSGITDVLKSRIKFIEDKINKEELMHVWSVIYIFDYIDTNLQSAFQIKKETLDFLSAKSLLRHNDNNFYFFDHDIIRRFFHKEYPNHILDCLLWVQEKACAKKIYKYPIAYLLYEISVLKSKTALLNACNGIANLSIPERLASVFYNNILDSLSELIESGEYEGIYLKYIHQICTYIRQYDGSEKAWHTTRQMYDLIQTSCPDAMSRDIKYYRPFIHFCCDIALQTHFFEEQELFTKDVLNACETACPVDKENKDELYVLQAIMYNRWYVSYNTRSNRQDVINKRSFLMKKSRQYGEKIEDTKKRGLIKYLNDSDEGYNFYGYLKDKEELLKIWDNCIIDIPTLVPEKTLNYYRKTVQYALIDQDKKAVKIETKKAMEYLEEGEFSHEPAIFQTFFLMAEVMSNIQHEPEETYLYNVGIIDNILKTQRLLNNHKLGDILMLKGVNAHYAKNKDEVYYSYKEAYAYYAKGETSRHWVKKTLLEENIKFSFTTLGIYESDYDISCFSDECRRPLNPEKIMGFQAGGIQRTGDLQLNLPLI